MSEMTVLRHYQQEAVDAVHREWEEHSSTLLVAATGTGKTTIFSEIIRRAAPTRASNYAKADSSIELAWFQSNHATGDRGKAFQAW
jgi:predicted helicase